MRERDGDWGKKRQRERQIARARDIKRDGEIEKDIQKKRDSNTQILTEACMRAYLRWAYARVSV